jgi:pyruvate dehydrogenase E1 component beta subunit
MIQQAIAGDDPVIFFEPKRRYWEKGDVDQSAADAPLGLHTTRLVRSGGDAAAGSGAAATLVAYGPMVRTCLQAADAAAGEGNELDVLDLRSLSPLDLDPVYESVRRTGRLVIVHEAPVFSGLGAEIAARVTEQCFYSLEAPVLRVGGFHAPYPPSRVEEIYLPDADRVLHTVDRALAF